MGLTREEVEDKVQTIIQQSGDSRDTYKQMDDDEPVNSQQANHAEWDTAAASSPREVVVRCAQSMCFLQQIIA